MTTTTKPPRRFHVWRWITGTAAALFILIVVVACASAATPPPGTSTAHAGKASPSATASPSASPVDLSARTVRFVITGDVPVSQYGSVDITYGSNNHTHNVSLQSLAGKIAYTVAYQPGADYYAADVLFTGPGHASVKIVVHGGPATVPLLVSSGSASSSGGDMSGGDASAQAAPNDRAGTSWQDES
jgi:hypothetical protein